MRFGFISRAAAVLSIGITLTQADGARADSYPSAPVHIVVGFAAGGGTDIVGRMVAQDLAARLGGSFIVLNKPGAGAMLGAEMVSKAAPDGYTLLLGTSAELTISPSLYGGAPYDPTRDFVPVAYLGASPAILLANPKYPGNSMRDVLVDARQNPGKLTMATGGAGTAPDLAAHQLKLVAGIDFVIAPYKGAEPSQSDAIAGHVPLVFSTIASALPFINNKLLKPLAVISDKRSSLVPDVPSASEQGLKDYAAVTWFGLFAPAGTPADIVAELRGAVQTMLNDVSTKEKFATLGIEAAPADYSAAVLAQRIKTELTGWAETIRAANITIR
jgi:tripartite-type tricarboxylate transporter receptor subunit TctC